MKQIVLTVGPRGAGKSTFCDQIIRSRPEIILVSRDAILIELFGGVYFDPCSGGHWIALDKMLCIVAEHMRQQQSKTLIIFDCWNGFPWERIIITEKLRLLGAEKIGAWCFITPENNCLEWYMAKKRAEDSKCGKITPKSEQESFRHDYRLYHSYPVDYEQGFDFIVKINPLNPTSIESLFYNFYKT